MVQEVMVGESSGWVRVFSGEDGNGTLVYLTRTTGVKDVCRDLVLPEYLTVWLQVRLPTSFFNKQLLLILGWERS